MQREHGRDGLDTAGGAEQVPGHRLGGRHGQLPRVLAEDPLDGERLELVVVGRRGAVRVDVVDVGGREARVLQRAGHRARGAVALGIGRRHVMRVARHPVPHDLAVDPGVAPARVLERLQHEDAPALAAHEAVAPGVERPRRLLRLVVARRHRLHRAEARDGQRHHDGLRAARDHHVGVAALDQAEGVAERVVAGGAGGDHGGVRPLGAEAHRDEPGRHVDDEHRDEERRDAVGALLDEHLVRVEERGDAADARADEHAEARAVQPGRVEAGVLDGHDGARHRVLEVRVEPARVLLVDVLQLVEVADLAGDARDELELAARRLGLRVEFRDRADAGLALRQRGPELGDIVAKGRERAHARDDDAAGFHGSTSCP